MVASRVSLIQSLPMLVPAYASRASRHVFLLAVRTARGKVRAVSCLALDHAQRLASAGEDLPVGAAQRRPAAAARTICQAEPHQGFGGADPGIAGDALQIGLERREIGRHALVALGFGAR